MRVPLKITPDAYMKALAAAEDEEHVHVTAIAEIQGTPEKLTKEAALSFEYPPIQVQVRRKPKARLGLGSQLCWNPGQKSQNCRENVMKLGSSFRRHPCPLP